ncbi:hypothetical protein XpiCFBP4643_19060 [Xanthomonas pisi]|uniref:Integrase n=2 Tax=Xanthomonas pisi TaxID=56457 RepID=A0A2S7CXY6_9XANT|nr:hypothetical protein XpiCFBP4643_19060 [Xanthomonas pisi]
MSFDARGDVVSRFKDQTWDFSEAAGKSCRLNFTSVSTQYPGIERMNIQTFKEIVAWWLFGERRVMKASSLHTYYSRFNLLVRFATRKGIDLKRFSELPGEIQQFAKQLRGSHVDMLLVELQALLTFSDRIGFIVFDKNAMRIFSRSLPDHKRRQTAYIPPRIWSYQLGRLNKYLTEFLQHKDKLIVAYRKACEAYLANKAFALASNNLDKTLYSPFLRSCERYPGAKYLGSMVDFLAEHGLLEFMETWRGRKEGIKLTSFGSMFSLANFCASAFIANLTGMRIGEVFSLRQNCLIAEADDILGKVYFIRGKTTKTLNEDESFWITCRDVQKALEVLEVVHAVRSSHSPHPSDAREDNRLLFTWCAEPWAAVKDRRPENADIRAPISAYGNWQIQFPQLFDPEELRIRPGDLDDARRVTPSLDPRRYTLGALWPLAWHQIRRTTAVNMSASGIVSDASLQYQLKHLSRSMSIYYGRGYSSKAISRDMQAEYLKEALESIARASSKLFEDRFVSPYGQEHKFRTLTGAAQHLSGNRKQTPVFRRTLLGVCVKATSCPSGGYDDIGPCMGENGSKGCPDAMVDRERRQVLERLLEHKRSEHSNYGIDEGRRSQIASQVRSLELSLELIDGT